MICNAQRVVMVLCINNSTCNMFYLSLLCRDMGCFWIPEYRLLHT